MQAELEGFPFISDMSQLLTVAHLLTVWRIMCYFFFLKTLHYFWNRHPNKTVGLKEVRDFWNHIYTIFQVKCVPGDRVGSLYPIAEEVFPYGKINKHWALLLYWEIPLSGVVARMFLEEQS